MRARPDLVAARPNTALVMLERDSVAPPTPDVLSEVLRAVRLTGAVYFDFHLSSPWILEAPESRQIVRTVMPGAERLIECHLIADGGCWGHAVGQEAIRLAEGDLIVFPQGDAHVLASAPGMRAAPSLSAFARKSTPLPMLYELGGGGTERTRVMCCFLGCDERPYNPLLAALPPVIHLRTAHDAATESLGILLQLAIRESDTARAGREDVLGRVSELLFVATLRRYVELLPPGERGWLAGLRDPVVGQALAALHAEPGEAWTVERLSRVVGVSRSVLAERFTGMVGHPPMQYLALWRMQLASRLLLQGRRVAAVAADVGYESEAAFSRAFKKLVGHAPASWARRASRPSTGTHPSVRR